ncbi:hypothetical protein QF031_000049 [Pseudarthrobacter defluvii]|uniref:hypothetical protein n=1 Tax=Pseudarthrobacter defluvii TaxID=410837 RepID=UPI002784C173|nr:hypothetical protein [Pseudarthrobacter defluvii]MDQ0767300.1 hypothetical protein [Pseudarthrobacter defluvii]
MLRALAHAGISLAEKLGNRRLVSAYDSHIRDALMADVSNAEHLVRKYLQKDASTKINLPDSFTPSDTRELLDKYLDSADANLNYVRLVATAPTDAQAGVDAKLKLKAKRRSERLVQELFKQESAVKIKTGVEVQLVDSQHEPVKAELDDMVTTFAYSRSWFDETLDNASILNNFQHLFEFADDQALLTLPSYPAELGIFDRFMTTTGRKDYQTGAAFNAKDLGSLLQTRLYQDYLSSRDISLETVIAWFFDTYLVEEFDALNFSFAPSAAASSYLERARHLFAEMEGLVNQFRHYVQDGELDRELLSITSDPVLYKQIPSLLDGKYVYATDHEEIRGVLHTLFDDQSRLKYINDTLKGESTAQLLIQNEVSYSDFREHQRSIVDQLIKLGVVEDTGARIEIADTQQLMLLHRLFTKQVAAYYRLSPHGRETVDAFETRGWVLRRSSLLTEGEASYFNYFLNKTEFSNGPELRNMYLHGSQPTSASESEHFRTYLIALRMLIALIIKFNDEFCLALTRKEVTS